MQSPVEHIKKRLLPLYTKEEVRAVTRLLLEKVCGIAPHRLLLHKDIKLSDTQTAQIDCCIDRLLCHEPVQYVLGETSFLGLTFAVTPDVLIPRPETEELVDMIVKSHGNEALKVLDIGTGSGCIAISLAKKLPAATVYAIDVSEGALAVAKKNAQANGADVVFLQHDVFNPLPDAPQLPGYFGLIVSNPPYVMGKERAAMRPNVLDFEPASALFVPDEEPLLFYRRIAEIALQRLAPDGVVYLEINALLGSETAALFEERGFTTQLICDITQRERFIKAQR